MSRLGTGGDHVRRFPRALLVCVALIFGIGTMLQQTGAFGINDDVFWIFYAIVGICAGILIVTAAAMRRNGYRKSGEKP